MLWICDRRLVMLLNIFPFQLIYQMKRLSFCFFAFSFSLMGFGLFLVHILSPEFFPMMFDWFDKNPFLYIDAPIASFDCLPRSIWLLNVNSTHIAMESLKKSGDAIKIKRTFYSLSLFLSFAPIHVVLFLLLELAKIPWIATSTPAGILYLHW